MSLLTQFSGLTPVVVLHGHARSPFPFLSSAAVTECSETVAAIERSEKTDTLTKQQD